MTDTSSREFPSFEDLRAEVARTPRRWLVTGGAGFIGSNLVETLLSLDQEVVCLDNFATGHHRNLREVEVLVGPARWRRFTLVEGDIRNLETCRKAVDGAEIVLHQAALGSVPRSIADPLTSNDVNVSGFLNMMVAARDAAVESFVYAASSSTYGDHEALPKVEARIGAPMSPYAVTKYVNELYASVFARAYGFEATGLRYFNVFGRRQDPNGAYAAVIPKWAAALVQNDTVQVNGDGETSRDFCYIDNAVQANIRAALAPPEARGEVFNVAVGDRTDLNTLIATLRSGLADIGIESRSEIVYRDFRAGDVRHSQADISKAAKLLGYRPTHRIAEGLSEAIPWYVRFFSEQKAA